MHGFRKACGQMQRMLVLFASLGCAACGESGGPCGLGAMADTAGWEVFDAGPFVFKLPPGYRDEHPIGMDSYVGQWSQGERTLFFTWGPYTADPRSQPNASRGTQCETIIGGRTAVVSESRGLALGGGQTYHLGGWWEKPDSMSANLFLGGSGPADDEAGRMIAATVLRTVRLRTVWSEDDRRRFTWRLCEISRVNEARAGIERMEPAEDPRNCPAVRPPPAVYDSVR